MPVKILQVSGLNIPPVEGETGRRGIGIRQESTLSTLYRDEELTELDEINIPHNVNHGAEVLFSLFTKDSVGRAPCLVTVPEVEYGRKCDSLAVAGRVYAENR
jgi:hypothetical protein